MSLTAKFVNNAQNIDIVDEVISLLSEKMNIDKTEAWKTVSDKSVEDLRKSVRKPKKKRAKTAYTMFSKDSSITEDLKKKHGEDITIGDMSKLKSELWKTLSEKDKEKYEQMAKDENEANPVVNDKPKKKSIVVRVGDLQYKTKKELEIIGRKIGIELDRRLTKQKLINRIKYKVRNKR